jgi:hypothetical protein
MTISWSAQLRRKFNVRLPPDVLDWFDEERWKMEADTTFNQPIEPAAILDPHSSAIWGGQMLPDTLPVLSDGSGNALCLRFALDGTLSEVILWHHEGGGWRPYGRTLAEALLFDAAINLLRDSDDAAALSVTSAKIDSPGFAEWALRWARTAEADDSPGRNNIHLNKSAPSLSSLLQNGLAEVAVRQELCRRCWSSELQQKCLQMGGQRIARGIGAEWPEFRRWLFDTQLMPPEYRERLSLLTRTPADELLRQDWPGAAYEAERVLSLRKDLAWPYAVLGWANERSGDLEAASGYYLAGLEALGTSEGFTAGWHQRTGAQYKFVAERLLELQQTTTSPLAQQAYLSALTASRHPAFGIREHWISKGQAAEQQEFYERAYYYYYSAGWDVLLTNDMNDLLNSLERVATQGGYGALAQLASHHRQSCI